MKAKWILANLFFCFFLFAANDKNFFEEKSDALAENTAAMLSELKQKAVVHWAENYLKDQFPIYQKLFTPEFCEKFISDYKVDRNPQTKALEISGHLDVNLLRRSLQLEEAKIKGTKEQSIQLVFSSQIPDLTVSHSDLGSVPFLIYLTSQIQQLAARYRLKNFAPITLNSPPKNKNEIEALRSKITSPFVLWINLKPGRVQRIIETDELWYLTSQSRILKSNSDEINFGNQSFRTNKDRNILKNISQQIANDFEDLVSSNSMMSFPITVKTEGMNLKTSLELQNILEGKEYFSNFRFSGKSQSSFSFEGFSTLTADSLASKVKEDLLEWPNASVTAQDAKTLLIRYSK